MIPGPRYARLRSVDRAAMPHGQMLSAGWARRVRVGLAPCSNDLRCRPRRHAAAPAAAAAAAAAAVAAAAAAVAAPASASAAAGPLLLLVVMEALSRMH